MRRICKDCGAPGERRLCHGCFLRRTYDPLAKIAHAAIMNAVARGHMERAKEHTCVDCGAQAFDWDHRDYAKPLEVQPVCRGCNVRRGPALNAQNHPETLERLFPRRPKPSESSDQKAA